MSTCLRHAMELLLTDPELKLIAASLGPSPFKERLTKDPDGVTASLARANDRDYL